MRDPETDWEWQDAVDAAKGALHLVGARMYGIVKGGPEVNVVRCEEILEKGAFLGFYPAPDAVERYIGALS